MTARKREGLGLGLKGGFILFDAYASRELVNDLKVERLCGLGKENDKSKASGE